MSKTATFLGVPLKWLSLLVLVVQNSMLVVVMKCSTSSLGSRDPKYLISTAVVVAEAGKFLISLCLYSNEKRRHGHNPFIALFSDMFGKSSDFLRILVPAVLYLIQNNLQYVAVSHLDAATFQVTYQFKIITTAIFSVLMLKKVLSRKKWFALIVLTVGIALVQFPTHSSSIPKTSVQVGADRWIGLSAVVTACIISGFAGVWFEKVLKGSPSSIWVRNMQLSFFSLLPGLVFGVYGNDRDLVLKNGFFYGYTAWTYAAITCQAVGGIIVAIVVKYADNILKGFATSLSIIVSCIASVYIFDFHISNLFILGSCFVLYATQLYGTPERKVLLDLPIHIKKEQRVL